MSGGERTEGRNALLTVASAEDSCGRRICANASSTGIDGDEHGGRMEAENEEGNEGKAASNEN